MNAAADRELADLTRRLFRHCQDLERLLELGLSPASVSDEARLIRETVDTIEAIAGDRAEKPEEER